MAFLTIHLGHRFARIEFDAPQPLYRLLAQADIPLAQPCGGHGMCGKCAVTISGSVSEPNAAENHCGVRLACQAAITGDAEVRLPTILPMVNIEGGSASDLIPIAPMQGRFGAAVDIGTTTIALLLYDLQSGRCIGSASMLNPQTSVAADVIGRIDAAMHGQADKLRQQVASAIMTMLASACANAGVLTEQIESLVTTGNTTMLYLLTGRDPSALSRAPFQADFLFAQETILFGRNAYLPQCLHAFVGADTTCALLASGMIETNETSLLCDVGTNGELTLWHHGDLYIASTAAGPAFEGAGISCGCASIPGAIDRVEIMDGELCCHTIGDAAPVGICGSGLLDAIASLLEIEALDGTGFLENGTVQLARNVRLTQADIRAVQLAKGATYAGIMSLLKAANCGLSEVKTLHLAGGFGSHLNIRSAVRIGLIPAALADQVRVIGNAALDGAAHLLMNTNARSRISAIENTVQHVRLDGNPTFSTLYIESMLFDVEDDS